MDTDKLRNTLGKIHPDRALVERVKSYQAQRAFFAMNRRKLYRIAYGMALVFVVILAAGIYRGYMEKEPGEEPSVIRAGDETREQTGASRVESQNALTAACFLEDQEAYVYENQRIILLDECTSEKVEIIITNPEEGMVCYTSGRADLAALFPGLFQNEPVLSEEGQRQAAVLVYRNGAWDEKLLGILEGDQAEGVIPEEYLEKILEFAR